MNIDIAPAVFLVLLCHGIFLSFFFFIHCGWNLNANFFLGLLLFVISMLALVQIIYQSLIFYDPQYNYLAELLISPFLFLYNSIRMQLAVTVRWHVPLVVILINVLLFYFIGIVTGPLYIVLIVTFILLNGLFLYGSFCLLFALITKSGGHWKYLAIMEYQGIIVINLLTSGIIIISIVFYMIRAIETSYILIFSKCLVICYIYYLILKKAGCDR